MPTASITISSGNRDASFFTIADTSDYTGVTVVKTDLILTDPNNNVYNIDIFDENFGAISSTYSITTTLAGYPSTDFEDGTYSFVLTATLDDNSVLTSATTYYLMDINVKKCWANKFEDAIDEGDVALTDAEKRNRTEVRELIQAAEVYFSQFRYTNASDLLKRANDLCNDECNC